MLCCCLATQHGSMLLPLCHSHMLALTMQEVLKIGDKLRTSLAGSETVVRVEGTRNLMHVACTHSIGGLSVEGSGMW